MWEVTAVVIGGLSFMTVVLIAWGLFGRADDTRPTCVRCRGDARRFAWAQPPVCSCGAKLDRPGAVRPSGRRRRRRVLASAVVPAIGCLAILLTAGWLERRSLHWPDLVPLAIVRASADGGSEWAAESIVRRHDAGHIDDLWLFDLEDRPAAGVSALSEHLYFVLDMRFAELIEVDGRGILPAEGLEGEILRRAAPIGMFAADPSAEGAIAVMLDGLRADTFIVLESVRVDGVPARWRLVPWGTYSRAGSRVATGRSRMEVLGPVDPAQPFPTSRGERRIEVELLLVASSAALAVVGDSLIDRPLDAEPSEPGSWGIDGRSMRLRLEATVPDPAAASNEDSVP